MNLIINSPVKGFEEIKQKDDNGNEFWSARDLYEILGYKQWESFQELFTRAKKACFISNQDIDYHFREVPKMIDLGKGGKREIKDIKLSRYGCYLIAQNGDPTKMTRK